MADTLALTILESPGLSRCRDLAETAFITRGTVTVAARRANPVWLPASRDCVYVAQTGDTFTAAEDGTPKAMINLVEVVFGRSLLARFAHADHVGIRFEGGWPAILAPCIEDEAGHDLCLDKARALITRDQRLYLAREHLAYAVHQAVVRIGTPRRGDPPGLTLRKIFGRPC